MNRKTFITIGLLVTFLVFPQKVQAAGKEPNFSVSLLCGNTQQSSGIENPYNKEFELTEAGLTQAIAYHNSVLQQPYQKYCPKNTNAKLYLWLSFNMPVEVVENYDYNLFEKLGSPKGTAEAILDPKVEKEKVKAFFDFITFFQKLKNRELK